MSSVCPTLPLAVDGDLLEAVLLRVDDEVFRQVDSGVEIGEDGIPLTGDPIVDEWEGELSRGNE